MNKKALNFQVAEFVDSLFNATLLEKIIWIEKGGITRYRLIQDCQYTEMRGSYEMQWDCVLKEFKVSLFKSMTSVCNKNRIEIFINNVPTVYTEEFIEGIYMINPISNLIGLLETRKLNITKNDIIKELTIELNRIISEK